MPVRTRLAAAAACATALVATSAFAQAPVAPSAASGSDVAAMVNKQPLTRAALAAYKRSTAEGANAPDDAALNQLVGIELLYQEGVKKGTDKAPDVVADLENQKRNIVARAVMRDLLAAKPVTEQDITQAYQQRIAQSGKQEIKLSHIVTATESDAKNVIAELQKGQPFAALAKTKSTDSASKDQGGSLPWLDLSKVPSNVRDAVQGLKPNGYSPTPVQTDMGWHVFLMEGVRNIAPPPLDAVKPQLRTLLENERISQHVEQLKSKAEITLK